MRELRANPDVGNPRAAVLRMMRRGYAPLSESGSPRSGVAMYRRLLREESAPPREYPTHRADGTPYDPAAIARRKDFDLLQDARESLGEAMSPTSVGALMRKGVKTEAQEASYFGTCERDEGGRCLPGGGGGSSAGVDDAISAVSSAATLAAQLPGPIGRVARIVKPIAHAANLASFSRKLWQPKAGPSRAERRAAARGRVASRARQLQKQWAVG